jgi:hypothetical protein
LLSATFTRRLFMGLENVRSILNLDENFDWMNFRQ